MSMYIPLFGPPCAGKSTAAKALDIPYFSSGDWIRANVSRADNLGLHLRQLCAQGAYLEDEIMMGEFWKAVPQQDLVLIDGIPRTLRQSQLFDEEVEKQAMNIPFGIYFECQKEILANRYEQRKFEQNRADDKLAYDARYQNFLRNDQQVVDWYAANGRLQVVDAAAKPEHVARQLESLVAVLNPQ